MKLPDPVIERLLEAWPLARLATVGESGRPHQVPVVFARVGGALWSPVDGKPKSGRPLARVENARREPRVSLLLDAWEEDWSLLWWLRVDGAASVVEPGSADEVAEVVAALRAKYPQYRDLRVLGDPPTLLRVAPERVRTWCAGPSAVSHLESRIIANVARGG